MQAAESFDEGFAGAQSEVIGIREDDFRAALGDLCGSQRLERAMGPDGHESRGLDRTVGRLDAASARAIARTLERESHRSLACLIRIRISHAAHRSPDPP